MMTRTEKIPFYINAVTTIYGKELDLQANLVQDSDDTITQLTLEFVEMLRTSNRSSNCAGSVGSVFLIGSGTLLVSDLVQIGQEYYIITNIDEPQNIITVDKPLKTDFSGVLYQSDKTGIYKASVVINDYGQYTISIFYGLDKVYLPINIIQDEELYLTNLKDELIQVKNSKKFVAFG